MRKDKKFALVILAHDKPEILREMVTNIHHFCPNFDILLYNSGDDPSFGEDLDVIKIQPSRRLYYARIIHFFFDTFEWLASNNVNYDYVTNIDSDVLFIRSGFEFFLYSIMENTDYMAQKFVRHTPYKSTWRPFHSLKPELQDWYQLFGFRYTNQAFNPGQTFSANYINKLLNFHKYGEIIKLVEKNQSYTLHEVLFPTLVDVLNLSAKAYPSELDPINRWRPYQAVSGVTRALLTPNAYFIHPVPMDNDNKARRLIYSLQDI
jgi:hypothetical protein